MLAVIATVFTILTFAATREDSSITHAKEQPPPVSELLRMLAKNVPFMQIIAGIGFFSFANILVTSGLVYYVKYYLGETEAIAGEAASLMQITITAMILPWTFAARYVGKRWAWQAGLAIAFAGLVGLYFSDAREVGVLYGFIVVYAIGSASIGINFWSIVPDTIEYGEWRTGVRAEAFVFGFVTLIQKVALGASSAFLGAYLGWVGYVANQPQSPETAEAIKVMITLVAAAGLIASALVMHFYRLDAKAHARLVQEIAARKPAPGIGLTPSPRPPQNRPGLRFQSSAARGGAWSTHSRLMRECNTERCGPRSSCLHGIGFAGSERNRHRHRKHPYPRAGGCSPSAVRPE